MDEVSAPFERCDALRDVQNQRVVQDTGNRNPCVSASRVSPAANGPANEAPLETTTSDVHQ